jgi:hypothetical protein
VIASVHIADLRPAAALGALRAAPKSAKVPGLCHADVGSAAPLSAKLLPAAQPGRIVLLAFWDDDESLDLFGATDPLAVRLADGWHTRLAPLRVHGAWPGVPDDLPTGRSVDHEGPAVVVTLGRLRISQAPRFFRTSAKAEGAAVVAPGFVWGTGFARPPFVATCSVWESSAALATYAYGRREPAHADAIHAGEEKDFHKRSAFIRFRPYATGGHLDGRNPFAGLPTD